MFVNSCCTRLCAGLVSSQRRLHNIGAMLARGLSIQYRFIARLSIDGHFAYIRAHHSSVTYGQPYSDSTLSRRPNMLCVWGSVCEGVCVCVYVITAEVIAKRQYKLMVTILVVLPQQEYRLLPSWPAISRCHIIHSFVCVLFFILSNIYGHVRTGAHFVHVMS